MQTIQIQQKGNVYSCDIGISKNEWLAILQDENTPQAYKETVLRFFYYPKHRGSCTAVCNAMGGNAQILSSDILELGKYVQKRLKRFQVERYNGMPCFWIIPMCEGKELSKESEGTFEWELRPELVAAVNDYLYWYLTERYKELRKEIPIDGTDWTELYKWQLITASKGKTTFEIIRDNAAHPNKATLGGFQNLIDAARDNKSIKYLVENKPVELEEALNKLADDSQPLNMRLAEYKSTIAKLLPPEGFNSKANDERTASVILSCVNPQKYTIYKYDVYTLFCKYLGLEKKPSGQCYGHFLDLLMPLSNLAAHDETLQQIVSSSLQGQEKSDLLLAQDILWMLFINFPDQIGYIRHIMFPNKQRVWLWSKTFMSSLQETLEIGSSSKTIKDFRPYKSKNALRKAYQQDVGNSDNKIPDAYWAFINEISVGDIVVAFEPKKGNGKQYHLLHGWGVITSDCIYNESNENPMSRGVQWWNFLEIPKQNEEMGNSLFFQGTTDEQALHIKELLNINTEKIMETKYQKYIDLLTSNKNLILTGAPGTGKSFMAIEIANELITQHSTAAQPIDVLHQAIDNYSKHSEMEQMYVSLLGSFYARFPKEKLKDMTLEDYCIGRGEDNKDNFCFWMERQLKPLGYYFPGSSRSYLLYWNKNDEEYKVHGYLKNEKIKNPELLMKILANDIHKMVNQDKPEDYVDKFGESFILKILNSYYPYEYAPINSRTHIDHIISLFNIKYQGQNVFEKNKAIYRFYKEKTKGKDISPFGFMSILYNHFNIKDGEMIENGEIRSEGEYRFVQFHPSYDYTDFVEGLRPVQEDKNSNIGFCRQDGVFKSLCLIASRNPNKRYVMIIDEINRGEISKVFGELFFSIDPGYRGNKIKVQTQYQNLIPESNDFHDGFYVPENVYIIGTMNDIDRSVESMDFAMRRRFAWQEVTAEESYTNMIENDSEFAQAKDEIKARMFNLNKAITDTEGLDEAYQIGAAYFRKYLDYQDKANAFDCLWENHLKGLLFEYLRGNRKAKELLEKLHKAYNNTSLNEQPAHTNEG